MSDKTTIIQGEKIVLELSIINEVDKTPFDLTDADEIDFCIKDVDGNILTKKLTVGGVAIDGDPLLGKILVTLDIVDTKLLKAEDNQSFDVEINKSTGEHRISKFDRALSVEKRICA